MAVNIGPRPSKPVCAKHGGEVFYTTDPKTTLPKGKWLEFDIRADGNWQPISVDLPTDNRIHQLRLDVSPGPGKAAIEGLTLSDQHGNVLITWPAARKFKQ